MTRERPEIEILFQPIFQEVPEQITEDWTWGALVGGMAAERDLVSVARAYKQAADILVRAALKSELPWEMLYPILFHYRHTLELYLKAILRPRNHNHDLISLITELEEYVLELREHNWPSWAYARLREFAEFDPTSTSFRYAEPDGNPSLGMETWVDLRHLSGVMTELCNGFEKLLK